MSAPVAAERAPQEPSRIPHNSNSDHHLFKQAHADTHRFGYRSTVLTDSSHHETRHISFLARVQSYLDPNGYASSRPVYCVMRRAVSASRKSPSWSAFTSYGMPSNSPARKCASAPGVPEHPEHGEATVSSDPLARRDGRHACSALEPSGEFHRQSDDGGEKDETILFCLRSIDCLCTHA